MFTESSSRLISPDLVSRSLAQEVLASQEAPGALATITGKLGQVQDLQEAMECLLYCLELDRGSVSSGELDIGAVHREGECTVFSSRLGVSIVTGSLRQGVDTKLELAQRLLVLQQLTLACSASTGLSPGSLDMIQSTFLPRTTVMVHCYSVMSWLCTAPVSPAPQFSVQQSLRQLAVLKMGEASSGGLTGQVEAGGQCTNQPGGDVCGPESLEQREGRVGGVGGGDHWCPLPGVLVSSPSRHN